MASGIPNMLSFLTPCLQITWHGHAQWTFWL